MTINSSSWSNATIISDNASLWNTGDNRDPEITVDDLGYVHAVWEDRTDGWWGKDDSEIFYSLYRPSIGWSNPVCISDNHNNWTTKYTINPDIAVNNGIVYVVYQESENGWWGIDSEIMCVNYTVAHGWSNITVVSDDNTLWNDLASQNPRIEIDSQGVVHVVWQDGTNSAAWGSDEEIMHASYTPSTQIWSNATVISDDYTLWNNWSSYDPDIAIDSGDNIHVVWEDYTDGPWGDDAEIMYTKYNQTTKTWSNATVISSINGWNDGHSEDPKIDIDGDDNIHVIWRDGTNGEWGTDIEIMYSCFNGSTWSNATIISDDHTGWNKQSDSDPDIAVSPNGTVYVVFATEEYIAGNDREIVYTYKDPNTGWTNLSVISDDATLWNNETSEEPSCFFDDSGNFFVIWRDYTTGWWQSDVEIMFSVNKGSSTTPTTPPIPGFLWIFMIIGLVMIPFILRKRSKLLK
ncbi:MAG: exo-alpha-sialidase [Promethearchaeota archaeon]|nr:MAG: exo-alpha-sialidase [Candidatus Lokiarchaeota archaeon]